MHQLPPVPALGLTLAIPKERVEAAIDQMIAKGRNLLAKKADSREMMEGLKRANWTWVLETSDELRKCFSSETVPLYFASNVYFVPSLKADDFERDVDEFPFIVGGRLERLAGFRKMAPIIPEPPCGDYLAALTHPRIYHSTWRAFELGQHGEAVVLAVKELEDTVSMLVAGNINAKGAELVRAAFDPENGPLCSPENTALENQGIADLLAGFFERYKGLPSSAPLSINQTARILSLATYLMYTLESIHLPPKEEEGVEGAPPEAEKPYEFEFLKE
ncbi:MAG: hypothetical protein JSS83_28330 [Cyanobacteria bacterium SZAS LIN-3]|nr:hypothetical protein [Cyanobacteria bacterium SZAS LIN-3]MBS2008329.1 hypothetical protein [Cyanobacteria bacterium SZAS TMP-1]